MSYGSQWLGSYDGQWLGYVPEVIADQSSGGVFDPSVYRVRQEIARAKRAKLREEERQHIELLASIGDTQAAIKLAIDNANAEIEEYQAKKRMINASNIAAIRAYMLRRH